MRLFASGIALAAALVTGACGGAAPDETSAPAAAAIPGDREELRRLEELSQADAKGAVAGLEAYIAKFPDDPRGHLQMARTLGNAVPVLPTEYTDADRATVERGVQHYRKVLDIKADDEFRAAAYMGLMLLYGPFKLDRPEEMIEPARQLIAMRQLMTNPHMSLANALVKLGRTDEAVQVWTDAERELTGRQRRDIAVGIEGFASINDDLPAAQMQKLVDVLTKVMSDTADPDPRAHAVALKLRAQHLETDPATRRTLLQQSAEWEKLADEANRKSLDELKVLIEELRRRTEATR